MKCTVPETLNLNLLSREIFPRFRQRNANNRPVGETGIFIRNNLFRISIFPGSAHCVRSIFASRCASENEARKYANYIDRCVIDRSNNGIDYSRSPITDQQLGRYFSPAAAMPRWASVWARVFKHLSPAWASTIRALLTRWENQSTCESSFR